MIVKIVKPGNGNPEYWYSKLVGYFFEVELTHNNSDRRNGFEKDQFETTKEVVNFCKGVINFSDAEIIE